MGAKDVTNLIQLGEGWKSQRTFTQKLRKIHHKIDAGKRHAKNTKHNAKLEPKGNPNPSKIYELTEKRMRNGSQKAPEAVLDRKSDP